MHLLNNVFPGSYINTSEGCYFVSIYSTPYRLFVTKIDDALGFPIEGEKTLTIDLTNVPIPQQD